MNGALAAASGAMVVLGLLAIGLGVRRGEPRPQPTRRSLSDSWARLTRRPPGKAGRNRDRWLLAGTGAGFVIFVVTGWPLAIVLAPLLTLLIPYLLGTPVQRDIALLEGLDRWVRSLAALIPTGKSVVDAIRAGRRQAPDVIAPEVDRLISRLDQRWQPEDALRSMADELDSADADPVLAALMLSIRRGGTGATATLKALSDNIQDQLRARREIEAERAKPRVVVRQVTVITLVMLAAATMFGQQFLAPYASQVGQVILAVLVVAYFASLVMLRRLTNPPRRDRILITERALFATPGRGEE